MAGDTRRGEFRNCMKGACKINPARSPFDVIVGGGSADTARAARLSAMRDAASSCLSKKLKSEKRTDLCDFQRLYAHNALGLNTGDNDVSRPMNNQGRGK